MRVIFALVCTVLYGVLIVFSGIVKSGVINGLNICFTIIIPSLFIFMVMTTFISNTGLHKIISIPFKPFTKYIFKLDDNLGSIVLMSFVGGYPVGATAISQLYSQNQITQKTAENMLCYCYCGAPSFIIAGVGQCIFGSTNIGIAIYLADIFAAIIIGRIVAKNNIKNTNLSKCGSQSFSEGFVNSVSISVKNICVMCGYIIMFSGILEFIRNSNSFSHLPYGNYILSIISGTLEVTSGCLDCRLLTGAMPYYFAVFFISFGGLSVLFQIFSIANNIPLNKLKIFYYRILHGIIAVLLCPITLKLVPSKTIDVLAVITPPKPIFLPHSPLVSLLIASMLCFVIFVPQTNCKTSIK